VVDVNLDDGDDTHTFWFNFSHKKYF
jgi:hypothetical protein